MADVSSDADKEFEETLAKLKASFAEALIERVSEIEALGNSLTSGVDQTESLEQLVHLSHRLAGSAASYQYDAVAVAVRVIEETAEALVQSASPADEQKIANLQSLTSGLGSHL